MQVLSFRRRRPLANQSRMTCIINLSFYDYIRCVFAVIVPDRQHKKQIYLTLVHKTMHRSKWHFTLKGDCNRHMHKVFRCLNILAACKWWFDPTNTLELEYSIPIFEYYYYSKICKLKYLIIRWYLGICSF